MATRVVGISLQEGALRRLDELAEREGVSRSGMVARLVEGAGRRAPSVVVDGRVFVPARGKKG